jgi:hypothetical protein
MLLCFGCCPPIELLMRSHGLLRPVIRVNMYLFCNETFVSALFLLYLKIELRPYTGPDTAIFMRTQITHASWRDTWAVLNLTPSNQPSLAYV